jgi:type I restriction enzyme S subunit
MAPLGKVLRHRKEFIEINDLEIYNRCRVQLHAQGILLRDQVPGVEIKTKMQQVCQAGEFLVAEIDAKFGGYGVVPRELEGAIVSSHYFLFGIDETQLDRRFLGYFIRRPGFHEQVTAQGSTNYAAIRARHVLEYQIPLPPPAEQRRLIERIDALATKIDEAKALRVEAVREGSVLSESILANAVAGSGFFRPLSELISPGTTISYGVLVPGNDHPGGVPFVRVQDLHPTDPPALPSKRIAPGVDAQYVRWTPLSRPKTTIS